MCVRGRHTSRQAHLKCDIWFIATAALLSRTWRMRCPSPCIGIPGAIRCLLLGQPQARLHAQSPLCTARSRARRRGACPSIRHPGRGQVLGLLALRQAPRAGFHVWSVASAELAALGLMLRARVRCSAGVRHCFKRVGVHTHAYPRVGQVIGRQCLRVHSARHRHANTHTHARAQKQYT